MQHRRDLLRLPNRSTLDMIARLKEETRLNWEKVEQNALNSGARTKISLEAISLDNMRSYN